MKSDIKTVCGLFVNESKKGTTYFSGSVKQPITISNDQKLMVFENQKYDGSPKSPKFHLCVVDKTPPQEEDLQW